MKKYWKIIGNSEIVLKEKEDLEPLLSNGLDKKIILSFACLLYQFILMNMQVLKLACNSAQRKTEQSKCNN